MQLAEGKPTLSNLILLTRDKDREAVDFLRTQQISAGVDP